MSVTVLISHQIRAQCYWNKLHPSEYTVSGSHTPHLGVSLVRHSEAQVLVSIINNPNPPAPGSLSDPCLIRILGRMKSVMNPYKFAFNPLLADDSLAYGDPHLLLSGSAYLTFQRLQNMIWKINTAVVILMVDHLFNVMSVNSETVN